MGRPADGKGGAKSPSSPHGSPGLSSRPRSQLPRPGRPAPLRAFGPGSRSCDVISKASALSSDTQPALQAPALKPCLLSLGGEGAEKRARAPPARVPRRPPAWPPPPPPPPRLHVQSGWSRHRQDAGPEPPPPGRSTLCKPAGPRGWLRYSGILQFPRPAQNQRWELKAPKVRLGEQGRERHVQGCRIPATLNVPGLSDRAAPEKESRAFPPPPGGTHWGRTLHAAPGARVAGPAPRPPAPFPRGKKLAAANGRPRRRLTFASWRAALPGDSGGGPVLSPPPARPPRRSRTPGLYIGRALAGYRVPAVRELPSAPRGGGPGTPGRGGALLASLLPPCRTPPDPPAGPRRCPRPLLSPPGRLSAPPRPSPVIRRGSSPATPPRGLLPTSRPAAPATAGSRNMSTTLLSAFYDVDFLCKVRRGAGRAGSSRSSSWTLPLSPGPGGRPSRPAFRVGKVPGFAKVCASALEEEGAAGRALVSRLSFSTADRGHAARGFPDGIRAAHLGGRGGGSRVETQRGPRWASSPLPLPPARSCCFCVCMGGGWTPSRDPPRVGEKEERNQAGSSSVARPESVFPFRFSSLPRSPSFGRRRNPWPTST